MGLIDDEREKIAQLQEVISDPRKSDLEIKEHILAHLCDQVKIQALKILNTKDGEGNPMDFIYVATALVEKDVEGFIHCVSQNLSH